MLRRFLCVRCTSREKTGCPQPSKFNLGCFRLLHYTGSIRLHERGAEGIRTLTSTVRKLAGIFWPVPMRPVNTIICTHLLGLLSATCPRLTASYQPGCSKRHSRWVP
jgi:hypothetical protein